MVSQYKVLSDSMCHAVKHQPLSSDTSGWHGAAVGPCPGSCVGKIAVFKRYSWFVFQKKKGLLVGMSLAAKLLGRQKAPEDPGTSQLQAADVVSLQE